MTVAVVIVAAGRHTHLRRALAALGSQSTPPGEVIVVDIGSDPPLEGEVDRSPCHAVRYVSLETGPGAHLALARGRNAGASSTAATDLVFLDVDCIAGRELTASYVDALLQVPGALVSGPVRYLVRDWDRNLDDLDDEVLSRRSQPHAVRPAPPRQGVRLGADHEMFWSLSFALRRATWDRIGGFDTGYEGYGAEDTDFGLRARELGIPMGWSSGGCAFHQWHGPTRLEPRRAVEIVANARRFHARWGWWPMLGWLTELDELGLVRFEPQRDRLEVSAGTEA